LAVAIPSKLILPSNITLVEQGKYRMLTLRGEHFCFAAQVLLLNSCLMMLKKQE